MVALSVEDPAAKAALAQTCRLARELLAASGWQEANLRYECTGGLSAILRLGMTRGRPRSLKLELGHPEMGLAWWIAERCDLSALERLEIRFVDGYSHTREQSSAAVNLGDAFAVQDTYGLGLVLAKLSASEHNYVGALWSRGVHLDETHSPLAEILSRSPRLEYL